MQRVYAIAIARQSNNDDTIEHCSIVLATSSSAYHITDILPLGDGLTISSSCYCNIVIAVLCHRVLSHFRVITIALDRVIMPVTYTSMTRWTTPPPPRGVATQLHTHRKSSKKVPSLKKSVLGGWGGVVCFFCFVFFLVFVIAVGAGLVYGYGTCPILF